MKTLFTMGFQSYDPFTVRHPLMGQAFTRGMSAAEIDAYTAKISAGRQKLARINAWIESKKAAQPFGWTLFDDEIRQAEFFNWLKTANTDQPSVDRVWNTIQNPSSPDYEVASEDIIRTNDWVNMVNYMTAAMEDYGVPQTQQVTQGPINPATGRPFVPTTLPGMTTTKPGMMPKTTAQTAQGGIPTSTLLLGGGAIVAAIALAALLKG